MFPQNENRNKGFGRFPGTKTGTRAHSPKPLSGRNSGKTPGTLSERPRIPLQSTVGMPHWAKPDNSRHLRLPEHFQNSLPLSTAGDASFFRNGSGELSEPVIEFPAVLRALLTFVSQ